MGFFGSILKVAANFVPGGSLAVAAIQAGSKLIKGDFKGAAKQVLGGGLSDKILGEFKASGLDIKTINTAEGRKKVKEVFGKLLGKNDTDLKDVLKIKDAKDLEKAKKKIAELQKIVNENDPTTKPKG